MTLAVSAIKWWCKTHTCPVLPYSIVLSIYWEEKQNEDSNQEVFTILLVVRHSLQDEDCLLTSELTLDRWEGRSLPRTFNYPGRGAFLGLESHHNRQVAVLTSREQCGHTKEDILFRDREGYFRMRPDTLWPNCVAQVSKEHKKLLSAGFSWFTVHMYLTHLEIIQVATRGNYFKWNS